MWSESELASVSTLAKSARNHLVPPKDLTSSLCVFAPQDYSRLVKGLSGKVGTVVARRLLEHSGVDESLPFRWYVDNKLVLNLLLHLHIPDVIPECVGLARAYLDSDGRGLQAHLSLLFPHGFVIKTTRGSGSTRDAVLGSSYKLPVEAEMRDILRVYDGTPQSEKYFVQKVIRATREYRVHTVNRSVIPRLLFKTFTDKQNESSSISLGEANSLVRTIDAALKLLPQGLCAGAVCGWDVGFDNENRMSIYEINYSGMHPEHRAGFQCSSTISNSEAAALNTAHLLHFFSDKCGVNYEFNFTPTRTDGEQEYVAFLYRASMWLRFLEALDIVTGLREETQLLTTDAPVSFRQLIYMNTAGPYDRLFVECVEWVTKVMRDERWNAYNLN
jgi:hypothetical protein